MLKDNESDQPVEQSIQSSNDFFDGSVGVDGSDKQEVANNIEVAEGLEGEEQGKGNKKEEKLAASLEREVDENEDGYDGSVEMTADDDWWFNTIDS